MQKITPFLWFNGNIEEAMDHYTSIFKNSKINNVHRVGGPKGKMLTATFNLEGQEFMALDGGPMFKFNEAISFFVSCKTQEEVDYFWDKLSEGGEKSRCGWLKDKFGLSWQIIPTALGELMGGPDPVKSKRVMDAMMKMGKIEISKLQEAHKGK
jgi:predicted 3-demethylubiquinone-9 3-methyltransferase (glyoxalase superfamily)